MTAMPLAPAELLELARAKGIAVIRTRLKTLGDHHAREIEREQRLERAAARGGIERREVGDFGLAEDVQPMRGEPLGVAGEHQAGARGFRRRNLAVEPAVPRERLELQGIAPLLEQVAHLGRLHAPRRRMGDLSSWRRTLATARFRALLWSAARAVPTCNTPRAAWSRTSTVGRPWSASNTTRASCGRGATRARRSISVRARPRSSGASSQ